MHHSIIKVRLLFDELKRRIDYVIQITEDSINTLDSAMKQFRDKHSIEFSSMAMMLKGLQNYLDIMLMIDKVITQYQDMNHLEDFMK